MIKKILLILISLIIACSCAIQQYSTYNNVSIFDNTGNKEYYSNVQVKTYEVTDTLSVVTFVDRNNHIYTICGKNIVIETIVIQRNGYNTRYIYYESAPRILYPNTYYRSNWYYYPRHYQYRVSPPRHNPGYRYSQPRNNPAYHNHNMNHHPPQGHNSHRRGSNSSHSNGRR